MASWNITDAVYKGLSFHVAIPKPNYKSAFGMTSQSISDERRLQVSEKPLVDGAEVSDFGRKPRQFSAEVIFFGSDYGVELKAFEDVLNQGTSGVLILPDLADAVYAKFQKSSRRSSAGDGNATMLSVAWIEDITKERLTNGLRTTTGVITETGGQSQVSATDKITEISKNSVDSLSVLTNNPLLKAISTAENAVTSARVTINSVLNVPKNSRQDILSSALRIGGEILGLQSAISGIQNYLSSLGINLATDTPTRYNTGAGQVDFKTVDTVSTTVIAGSQQVVSIKSKAPETVSSLAEAVKKLKARSSAISTAKSDLEVKTMGATNDFSLSSVQLINSVNDLILLLSPPADKKIMTTYHTSLIEVCFENGLTIADIPTVQAKNTFLDDILDVPRFTVLSI